MWFSYRSPKTEVRQSTIHGRRLFAIADSGEDEIVAVKGGHIIDRKTWRDDYSVECNCGAPGCRKILTGKGWQRVDLQKRYIGYFSPYLARKIASLDIRC
jgi:hypothetical protein